MTGKEAYRSTFDEINVSPQMMTRLMLQNGNVVVMENSYGIVYRAIKAIVTFITVLTASGVLFSVPIS